MKNVYTCIDIGSDSVKIIVCQLFNNKLNLLAASSVKSHGIIKGIIMDEELATISIKKAIKEVEEMLGIKIKKVIASIPNYDATFALGVGQAKIDEEHGVLGKNITEALEASTKKIIKENNEVVNILPVDFQIDSQRGILDPRSKNGNVLTARSIVSLAPKKNIYLIVKLLENIGLEVVDISLNCVGDINTFKNKQTEMSVGAIVNIGYEKTDISLYNKDIVLKTSSLDIGSRSIDNDIAYMYKLNLEDTVTIKEKFALAHKRYAGKGNSYEIVNKLGEKIRINQFEVSEVVMSRIEEILSLARKEINTLTKREVDYIIITGGISSMDNFTMLAEEVLGNIVKVGNIKILGIRNNKYSSAVGNIIYFINKLKLRNIDYSMLDEYEYDNEKNIMNVINDSVLGKVFGYFFE